MANNKPMQRLTSGQARPSDGMDILYIPTIYINLFIGAREYSCTVSLDRGDRCSALLASLDYYTACALTRPKWIILYNLY